MVGLIGIPVTEPAFIVCSLRVHPDWATTCSEKSPVESEFAELDPDGQSTHTLAYESATPSQSTRPDTVTVVGRATVTSVWGGVRVRSWVVLGVPEPLVVTLAGPVGVPMILRWATPSGLVVPQALYR